MVREIYPPWKWMTKYPRHLQTLLRHRKAEKGGMDAIKDDESSAGQQAFYLSSTSDTAMSQLMPHVVAYRQLKPPLDTLSLHRSHLQQIASCLSSNGDVSENSSTRIWQDIIFHTLDILENEAKEHRLRFLLLAYTTMKDLWMRVPVSPRVWVDSMRSLTAHRLTIDDAGQDRNWWSLEARFWFNVSTECNSTTSCDYLKQMSEYARSLTAKSTMNGRVGISGTELFTSILRWKDDTSFVAVFVRAHAMVFSGQLVDQSDMLLALAPSGILLETYIRHVDTAFQLDGIYIATINIAALLEYGGIQNRTGNSGPPHHQVEASVRCWFSQIITTILRTRDSNIFPFLYVTLIFLWNLMTTETRRPVSDLIPWAEIGLFMEQMTWNTKSEVPLYGEGLEVLPEDSIMRDQLYYNTLLPIQFEEGEQQDDLRGTEMISRRAGRIRWLWENLVS